MIDSIQASAFFGNMKRAMDFLKEKEVDDLSNCFYALLYISKCRERHVFKLTDLYAYFLRRVKNHGAMSHLAYDYANELKEDVIRTLCRFFLSDASRKIINSAIESMLSYMQMPLPKGDVVKYLYKRRQSSFRLDERNGFLLGVLLSSGRLIFSEREHYFLNNVLPIDDKTEMALIYLCVHNKHFLSICNQRVRDNHRIMSHVTKIKPDLYRYASSNVQRLLRM